MGRFSTTVHIKTEYDRAEFIDLFSELVKNSGLAPCAQDEAEQSIILAFSEGWVTLADPNYNSDPQCAYTDLNEISEALNTSGFSVEVVDSDFAALTLSGGDVVTVGDASAYGIEEPMCGTRELWEPLFSNGTWEQFGEIIRQQNVFVEETLVALSGIFKIAPEFICADYEELADDNAENTAVLYFKKS